MCLTSNLKVETVASYDVHHLGYWYFKKHPLIICVSKTEILLSITVILYDTVPVLQVMYVLVALVPRLSSKILSKTADDGLESRVYYSVA